MDDQHDSDPFCLELVLNGVKLAPLLESVQAMEGTLFFHPQKKGNTTFKFDLVQRALRGCLEWAKTSSPEDVREQNDLQQLAAIRAWTCTPVCYVVNFVLRDPHRTAKSVQPVLLYVRLFFTGLHALPRTDAYIIVDATLYRGENSVMTTWDAKMVPGGNIMFVVPTSFSSDPAVVQNFTDQGPRTVIIIHGASGWKLAAFSPYDEAEVLVEPVSKFRVIKAEKFDAHHRDVQMGEVKEGLHRVEGHVLPGVALLEGSPVKENEAESFYKWQWREEEQQYGTPLIEDLKPDPYTDEEWEARGKKVPQNDKALRMSVLGKGAFMSTIRMATPNGVRYAVKVVERDDMEIQGITEEHVRKEARVLRLMRHKHVIRYISLLETDERMGLVMELAEGGSLADLIKARGSVQVEVVWAIAGQLASALAYIHLQGIVHRDVKADNILLAHADGTQPVCVKLADFGVSAVLATVAGSALQSKVGTPVYLAPERGNEQA